MACLFLHFISLRFLSQGTSEVYSSCYRSQRHPGLATTNAEWISGDTHETWNFPRGKAITVQTCNVPPWRSKWTLSAFFFYSEGHSSETMLQRAYALIFFLLLWCRFTFCMFGHAFFVYPVFSVYGMHKKQIQIDWCSTPEWHTRSNANDARLNSLTPPWYLENGHLSTKETICSFFKLVNLWFHYKRNIFPCFKGLLRNKRLIPVHKQSCQNITVTQTYITEAKILFKIQKTKISNAIYYSKLRILGFRCHDKRNITSNQCMLVFQLPF